MIALEQEFQGQEWPFEPGERMVKMHVETPPSGINSNTGMMLVLHSWGDVYNSPHYLAWCKTFSEKYNVISASVNYLQSGEAGYQIGTDRAYDYGYLQAIDSLRALYHIQRQLKEAGIGFNPHRCYSMGGSGGGNVTQMSNKFAPHTFACVVDICGMPGFTEWLAFGDGEYKSLINAGYSRNPESPLYLSKDMWEIRDFGNPAHLRIQYEANQNNKVVIVHGLDDDTCPAAPKIGIFRNMVDAGFRPDAHFLTPWFVDGEAVTTTGHPVGNRDKVVQQYADAYLLEDGEMALQISGPNDFERESEVIYPTCNGKYVIDYSQGPPTISFVRV